MAAASESASQFRRMWPKPSSRNSSSTARSAAADLAVLLELRDDGFGHIRRHCEADSDAAAIRRVDRRVDADHLAVQIERRAAGIAAVYRRVDLQEIIEWTGVDVASPRRDDPGGNRAAEPKGIADRHHPVAYLSSAAVGKRHERQRFVGIDLQHRDVRLGVAADDLRRVLAVVLKGHFDLAGIADDVAVGHHITRRIDNEAGTESDPMRSAARHLREDMTLAVRALLVEEAAQH